MDARGPSVIAAHALSHDPEAALVDIAAVLEILEGPEADDARAAMVFILVLNCEFDAAMDLANSLGLYDDRRPILDAARAFAAAVCTAGVTTDLTVTRALQGSEYDELIGFLDTENAMSSGQITTAEALARSRIDASPGETVFWAWAGVALARSYCFQGRLEEARAALKPVLSSEHREDWPLVTRIASGVEAFINGHEGRRRDVAAYSSELRRSLTHPKIYMHTSAFVLAALAEAAYGDFRNAAADLLHGGGGNYLPRLQIVDRAYGYEILVENELARGDLDAARTWISLAELLPFDDHDMAAAAVGRTKARLSLVASDPGTSARESAASGQRASSVGGRLEVIRAQILEAAAQAAAGDRSVSVPALEEAARLAAASGSGTIRAWAVRELRRLGRRLRNVPGIGWEALSLRQQLIARMAAQGMRNKEIAANLFLSEKTVESHISAILNALGSPTRVGIGNAVPREAHVRTATGGLTGRQLDVARLIAQGITNSQIAVTLEISDKTVEKHIAGIFERLGVRSRTAIAAHLRGEEVGL